MKSDFNKKVSVISEDILEIKIDLENSTIKGSELYWHLAEHLLSNQNDIEVIASEEMVSVTVSYTHLTLPTKRIV